MERLIDCTYFTKGERSVLGAPLLENTTDQGEMAVRDAILGYVDTLQGQFLKEAVGKVTAALLQEYLDLKAAIAMEGVLDGEDAEFTEDEGLEWLAQQLREPFADYVFYHILRHSRHQPTISGLVALKCANDYVSPARRQASSWNRMVDRLYDFLVEARKRVGYSVVVSLNFCTKINSLNL